jgi:hypothetical protein
MKNGLRVAAGIAQVQQHVHGNSRDRGREPDKRGRPAPLAMLAELHLERQRQRRQSECGTDRREYDVEYQEDRVQHLERVRSAPRRIPDEHRPGHINDEEEKSGYRSRQHHFLVRFPSTLDNESPSYGD